MELLLFVMAIALIPALIARSKGRSGFLWWIYGCLLFIVALPHALLASDLNREPCPYCAERILKTARICPHCRHEIGDGGIVKSYKGVRILVEREQRAALAKAMIGEPVSLISERAEGYPLRIRVESRHGPVGYLYQPDVAEIQRLIERNDHAGEIEDSGYGVCKLALRFYRRPPARPLELTTAA